MIIRTIHESRIAKIHKRRERQQPPGYWRGILSNQAILKALCTRSAGFVDRTGRLHERKQTYRTRTSNQRKAAATWTPHRELPAASSRAQDWLITKIRANIAATKILHRGEKREAQRLLKALHHLLLQLARSLHGPQTRARG